MIFWSLDAMMIDGAHGRHLAGLFCLALLLSLLLSLIRVHRSRFELSKVN